MCFLPPQVSHNPNKNDPNYDKWAVIKEDIPSSPGDIGMFFPDENLVFLNTNLEWKPEPFVMNTKKEAEDLLARYKEKEENLLACCEERQPTDKTQSAG